MVTAYIIASCAAMFFGLVAIYYADRAEALEQTNRDLRDKLKRQSRDMAVMAYINDARETLVVIPHGARGEIERVGFSLDEMA